MVPARRTPVLAALVDAGGAKLTVTELPVNQTDSKATKSALTLLQIIFRRFLHH